METNRENILSNINTAIEEIRPYLKADGGNVELVDLEPDNTVKVRLMGACDGCPFSMMTLRAGIEQAIRKKFPEMKELVAIE
ncbi:MAG TPA: NifU family protein [Bacteroidales bacterium]|nr:NifU family protein [Bacteroidales bacterium]